MRSYTTYKNSLMGYDDAGTFLIKEGFSWFGIFIPLFFLLYHKMCRVAGGLLVTRFGVDLIGASLFSKYVAGVAPMLADAINVLMGYEGNNLRRWTLNRLGYRIVAVVVTSDLFQAERRYFANSNPLIGLPPTQTYSPESVRYTVPFHSYYESAFGVFPPYGSVV
ncbi:MAG: DUF2628 domain-containing protein [Parvularculales bacterium]